MHKPVYSFRWWQLLPVLVVALGAAVACTPDDETDETTAGPNEALRSALVADTGTVWVPQYVVFVRIDSADDDTQRYYRTLSSGALDTLFPYQQQRFLADGQATFSSRTAKNAPWKTKTWAWNMRDNVVRIQDDSTAATDYQRILECTPDTLRADVVRYTTPYLYKRYTVVYSAAVP